MPSSQLYGHQLSLRQQLIAADLPLMSTKSLVAKPSRSLSFKSTPTIRSGSHGEFQILQLGQGTFDKFPQGLLRVPTLVPKPPSAGEVARSLIPRKPAGSTPNPKLRWRPKMTN